MNTNPYNTTVAVVGVLTATIGQSQVVNFAPVNQSPSNFQTASYRESASNLPDFRQVIDSILVETRSTSALLSAVSVHSLLGHDLIRAFNVLVEADESAFLARAPDLPQLYGHGDTPQEAVDSLIDNVESLWEDLNADENFTDEWLLARDYLNSLVAV